MMSNRSKNWKNKEEKNLKAGNVQDALVDDIKVKQQRKSAPKSRKPASYKNAGKSRRFNNHIEWYNKIPQLMKDAASISSATMAGVPYTLRGSKLGNTTEQPFEHPAHRLDPSILTITWAPSVGKENQNNPATTAINVSATSLFGFITHANSRNTTYDASDLMMYILAVSDAYNYLAFMRRLYGRLTPYSAIDRSTPQTIMHALGGNYDNLAVNAANFRTFINLYTQKLGQLAMPAGLAYHERHMWMNESLFIDSNNSEKRQYYAFTQSAYFVYEEKTPNKPGYLRLARPSHTQAGNTREFSCGDDFTNRAVFGNRVSGLTLDEIVAFGNDLINRLIWSEDINKISADIIKACSNLYKVALIDEAYSVPAVYDTDVTVQFENFYAFTPNFGQSAPIVPLGYVEQNSNIGAGYVFDNVAFLCKFPTAEQTDVNRLTALDFTDALLNMHGSDMTPEFVMRATRTKAMGFKAYQLPDTAGIDINHIRDGWNANPDQAAVPGPGIWSTYTYSLVGSEYCYRATMWTNCLNKDHLPFWILGQPVEQVLNLRDAGDLHYTRADLEFCLNTIMGIQAFDWHPLTSVNLLENFTSEQWEYFPIPYIGIDLDNFTTVDSSVISKIHNVALLSEFMFEGLGNYGVK